jgi:AcrR family transcriptional regulator
MDNPEDSELPENIELPGSLRRLWGLDRTRAGATRNLSLDRVVAAAIELADTEGLPALSMARLADRLGSKPMSLYRHVDSKDDLLAFMIDATSRQPGPPEQTGPDWRAGLQRWANDLMAVYRRHPWVLHLPMTGPPLEPGQLAWLESGLRAQQDTALTPAEKLLVVLTLLGYVRGQAAVHIGLAEAAAPPSKLSYGATLDRLVDADSFPALTELIRAGVFDADRDSGESDESFLFGLEVLLDGVQALVDAHR